MRSIPARTRPTARRSSVRLIAALAVAGLALAGCSGGGSTSSTPLDTAAPVKLTWWTGQNADAQKTLEALAKEFSGLHPNVTIEASSGAPTTDDLLQKLTAEIGRAHV